MMINRNAIAVAFSLAVSATAFANDGPTDRAWDMAKSIADRGLQTPVLSLSPQDARALSNAQDAAAQTDHLTTPTLFLDAGGTASRVHGFGDFRIANSYTTPRGLVVLNAGVQFQPLFGLVLDVYHGDGPINGVSLIGGTWGDLTSYHPGGDIWNEQDFFAGFSVKFLDKFDFSYTIMAWAFPDISNKAESNPNTEYNMDFKFSYDDSEYLKEWALHPYVDIFWNFCGDNSPVVADALLGKNDHTFYVEVGISPSYTIKAMSDYPITLTMPTYFSFGDSSFWGETPGGDRSNIGVFSTGLKASVPLTFIPKDFGAWNAYVGVTYIHTCNPALSYVNENIMGQGGDENRIYGYAGVGFGF